MIVVDRLVESLNRMASTFFRSRFLPVPEDGKVPVTYQTHGKGGETQNRDTHIRVRTIFSCCYRTDVTGRIVAKISNASNRRHRQEKTNDPAEDATDDSPSQRHEPQKEMRMTNMQVSVHRNTHQG